MRLPESDTHFAPYVKAGQYQKATFDEAMKYVRKFDFAIDVGAHVGFWTREMAAHFDCVFSFEPVMENYLCLCENVSTLSNVTTVYSAVGAREGECGMRNPAPGNSGAWEASASGGGTRVRALDEFPLSGVGLIKIDVQGSELDVLKGAARTLIREKPIVIVECVLNGKLDPEPGNYLVALGAKPVCRVNKDVIYAW